MKVQVDRRVFLGSAAVAGVGSVTGGFRLSQGINAQAVRAERAVEQALATELRGSVRGMSGPRRGESARRLASILRLAAAQHKEKATDAAFKEYLEAAIKREGRDAVLHRELDQRMLAAEARDFGITRLPPPAPVDIALRSKALDALLNGGLTPLMIRAAETFDAISEGLDNQPLTVFASARQVSVCPDLTNQLRILDIAVAIACLWNPALCVVLTGMWTGLMISLWAYGC